MSLPYFPMYPTDFEADTSHLTLAEDGAYNRLLRLMWMTPGCSLPADDKWIMRRMRVTQDEFEAVVRVVMDEFFTIKSGRLTNPKLAKIFAETDVAHKKRVDAGSKGGKAKSLKTNKSASSNALAKPKQPEPEPEPIEVDKSTSQEAAEYLRYLEAHPRSVESKTGERKFSALIEAGEDAGRIIASAGAYAETVKSWSSEAKVQQSDNFLDAERGKWREFIPKPKAVPVTEAQRMEFWANSINEGRFVSDNQITPTFARQMIEAGLVTPEKLAERGITA